MSWLCVAIINVIRICVKRNKVVNVLLKLVLISAENTGELYV